MSSILRVKSLPSVTALALTAVCFAQLATTAPAQLVFADRTSYAQLDVDLAHISDHPAMIMDGGGSVGDFNMDGWPDLYVPSTGIYPNRLFINQQNGRFEDQAAQWNMDDLFRGVSSCVGDFDKNGYPDIFVTNFGNVPGPTVPGLNRLYRNLGNGSFEEVGDLAGVRGTPVQPDGFGCTFGDYDLDGDLDLYVTGWAPFSLGNQLFRNEGDGTFVEVTSAAGLYDEYLRGFAPRFVDLDGDRYPGLLIAGDFGTTALYSNDRDGSFTNATAKLQPDKVHYGMGAAIGDFNNDMKIDWYVTSIFQDVGSQVPNGNRLYYYQGTGAGLMAAPESAGVNDGGWGWGTVAADFDHDGLLDIMETNGWNQPEWMGEQVYLYRNLGNGSFEESAQACNLQHTGQGRCLVKLDYDNDGDMDVIVFSNQEGMTLYRNNLAHNATTNWIRIDLNSDGNPALAPGGYGTRIEIEGTVNGQNYQRCAYLDGGNTYLGVSQMTTHFGLANGAIIDQVRVLWADGWRTVLNDVAINQILTVTAQKPYSNTGFERGKRSELIVEGAEPGELIRFVFGTNGAGTGPCLPELGGLCLDVIAPVWSLGVAVADADGRAVERARVPSWMPLIDITSQAYAVRGSNGDLSAKTNVRVDRVLP